MDNELTPIQELWIECGNLAAHAGIIDSIMGRYSEDVQEAWTERLKGVVGFMQEQILEMHAFGGAFDEAE